MYDASYLELAQRLALPFAALDQELCEAAKAEGVPLVELKT
jgi:predicted nucleic acid-binding protein